MSYELLITRADQAWETKDHPISEAEWKVVVDEDPDLVLSTVDFYDRKSDAGHIERFHPCLIASHPSKQPLWFMDGAINTANPDKAAIRKMVEISNKLDAKVIGEEGEIYDINGNCKYPE